MVVRSVLAFVFLITDKLLLQWNNYNRFLIMQLKP